MVSLDRPVRGTSSSDDVVQAFLVLRAQIRVVLVELADELASVTIELGLELGVGEPGRGRACEEGDQAFVEDPRGEEGVVARRTTNLGRTEASYQLGQTCVRLCLEFLARLAVAVCRGADRADQLSGQAHRVCLAV